MADRQTPSAPPASDQSLTGPQNAFTGNTTDVGPSPTSYPSGFTPHPPSYPPQSQFPFAHPPPSQVHYAPLNPGFSNHGFQSQSQGSNPSSFVFGSIPPSAGSNPNFAAGYNPAAMAGTSMPSYSQMPMFGPAPNS
ncbi:hypothetical protein BT96DRAFT_1007434, partial [Gymnopus androsaceus JB14]